MRIGIIAGGTAGLMLVAAAGAARAASTITSLDFRVTGTESVLEIRGDGPLAFTSQENQSDRQVVIDLEGAKLGTAARRRLDTSSFDSRVTLVSPYQVDAREGVPAARVVVQLRDWSRPRVSSNGTVVQVRVPNAGGASEDGAGPDRTATSSAGPEATAEESATPDGEPEAVAMGRAAPARGETGSAAEAPRSEIQTFLDNREARRFAGRPITLQVKEAELTDVFRLIGEASGFNIVMSEDVKGKLTLSLTDVPWDQALDLILRSQRLGAERSHNVLRIVSLENLTREKRAELEAQAAQVASTPRITRIFPVNYARLADLTQVLTRFAATATGAQGGATALTETVLIQADERTNSIIVRDTPANVEKMRRLIELLDTQTPQVMVEAKIIEASEGFGNSLTGRLGLRSPTRVAAGINGGDVSATGLVSSLTNTVFGSGGTPATGSSGFAMTTPSFSLFKGTQRLNAFLQLQENETRIKVVSAPRTVVLNKEQSTIVQSTPVLVPQILNTATGPVTIENVQQANLSLSVTPSVTNDAAVLMDLNVSRDVPQNRAVANRNIRT
jgi:type IV pilus assembly protein PilQ